MVRVHLRGPPIHGMHLRLIKTGHKTIISSVAKMNLKRLEDQVTARHLPNARKIQTVTVTIAVDILTQRKNQLPPLAPP